MSVARPERDHPVLDLLVERDAGGVAHPGGTLREHLLRVAALLEEWGASEDVPMAGLCHTCYGTDGFPASLLRLDERDGLAGRIGRRAAAWVYFGACCDRSAVYPARRVPGALRFRGRFTGETSLVTELDAAVLAELTAADELDIVMVNRAWGAKVGPDLLDLVRGIGPRLSPSPRDGWNTWADLSLTQSDGP